MNELNKHYSISHKNRTNLTSSKSSQLKKNDLKNRQNHHN